MPQIFRHDAEATTVATLVSVLSRFSEWAWRIR
jgi:hypothetical protein